MSTTLAAVRPETPSRPAFATRAVLLVAGLVALGHLVASAFGGYWFDEAYMLSLGRNHLDWGFVDQPPLVPLLAAFTDWVGSGSLIVLRLPAVAATAGTVVLAALIAREFGGDRRAQLLTAAAQSAAVWITLTGHWMTPYTFEPLVWTLVLWLLVRWIRVRDDRLLLGLGLAAGLGAEIKFQVMLFCVVLLVAVAGLGPRELLRRPLLWAGVGVAVLGALPTLLWQAAHDWPQLRMASVVAQESTTTSGAGPVGLAVSLIVLAGLAGTVLVLIGLWTLLRGRALRPYRFVGVAFVLLYLAFVFTGGRLYYLGGMYPLGIAAGAVALQRRRDTGRTRGAWLYWPAVALSALSAAAVLVVSTLTVPESSWGANLAGVRSADELTADTAAVYRALPAAAREHTVLIGQTFIITAYLDGYGRDHDLPTAYSTNRGYGLVDPPPESADAAVFVGTSPAALAGYFGSVRQVGTAGGAGAPGIWVLTDRRVDWSRIWREQGTLAI